MKPNFTITLAEMQGEHVTEKMFEVLANQMYSHKMDTKKYFAASTAQEYFGRIVELVKTKFPAHPFWSPDTNLVSGKGDLRSLRDDVHNLESVVRTGFTQILGVLGGGGGCSPRKRMRECEEGKEVVTTSSSTSSSSNSITPVAPIKKGKPATFFLNQAKPSETKPSAKDLDLSLMIYEISEKKAMHSMENGIAFGYADGNKIKEATKYARTIMTDTEYTDLRAGSKTKTELMQICKDVEIRCMTGLLDSENGQLSQGEKLKGGKRQKPTVIAIGSRVNILERKGNN